MQSLSNTKSQDDEEEKDETIVEFFYLKKFYSKLYCYHENSQKLNPNIYFRKHIYFIYPHIPWCFFVLRFSKP